MLRKIRISLAAIFFLGLNLLLLDFTGVLHTWLGWMAKIQFFPAVMASHFVIVALLLVLTLVLGRVYCSVICPLGVMQDVFAFFGRKAKKNRYSWSPAKSWLRYSMLALFVVLVILGIGSLVALLAPYSAYGRIAQNLFQPVWIWINNLLALVAEKAESYAFYHKDVWLKSISSLLVASLTFVVLGWLSWRNGRTWCNTICPVGTLLGCLSRFSLMRPVIDTDKCNGCLKCARNCKASCIDPKAHKIDYSRCVTCFDCLENCRQGAISYRFVKPAKCGFQKADSRPASEQPADGMSRRAFLGVGAIAATTLTLEAKERNVRKKVAELENKKAPERQTPIVPAGAVSQKHFAQHCTGCQLCISACPNQVLRPSGKFMTLLQPTLSYEKGWCRPECTRCSEVCPSGAILRIGREEKSSTQIGHAVWIKENCIPLTQGDACGNCARHCPNGAITMVPSDPGRRNSPKIPVVDEERCIGCGACEHVCPSRPVSAIYVEGHEIHKTI